MDTCKSHYVFAQGFFHGVLGIAAETAREVEERFPDYTESTLVTVYLNGAEDGKRGDPFRLDMPCGLCGKGNMP